MAWSTSLSPAPACASQLPVCPRSIPGARARPRASGAAAAPRHTPRRACNRQRHLRTSHALGLGSLDTHTVTDTVGRHRSRDQRGGKSDGAAAAPHRGVCLILSAA
ncbi:hypothetical protein HYPSUDRAFT_685075 [Hypholoma sublateritium FD-334 SS-4]|uniref:Uncharacterized protein n=1 Tax=Hypholoma sublateritium (strain FD-334 SS-4) TaxID=945553 RepID=A0A0D2NYT4_HYPSF|nr:hypothetical protein HYPSUDRAFT_685075 [Hypholoma sublateritium FD-334 SS-4]